MNVDYPFHFDARGRTATTDENDHVRDMIEQLLFCNPGERVNRVDFGGGLNQHVLGPNSAEVAGALQFTLQAALQQWLGDVIEVHALHVVSADSTLAIELSYVVKATGQQMLKEPFPVRSA